jgi:hypothetical protein
VGTHDGLNWLASNVAQPTVQTYAALTKRALCGQFSFEPLCLDRVSVETEEYWWLVLTSAPWGPNQILRLELVLGLLNALDLQGIERWTFRGWAIASSESGTARARA